MQLREEKIEEAFILDNMIDINTVINNVAVFYNNIIHN